MSPRQASDSDSNGGGKQWSGPVRLVVSGLLVWHLVAVVLGPLSLPPSILASAVQPLFRPYIRAAFLDHSYKFFAPDPGPSHLIRYDVTLADGTHRRVHVPELERALAAVAVSSPFHADRAHRQRPARADV